MSVQARRAQAVASVALAGLIVTGCSAPGGSQITSSGVEVSTEIGPDPVTIAVRVNADQEDMWKALVAGFEESYPSVNVDLQTEAFGTLQDNAPRYLSGSNVPDLFRLAVPGDTVRDGLLLDLDPYAAAWGWDEFPSSQLDQWRIAENGSVGTGPLYALGAGFGLVGIYYNAEKLEGLGIDNVPATVDELEAALAVAQAAGETPLIGDAAYILQLLIQAYGGADATRQWINNVPEASIDVPAAADAAETLQRWSSSGYVPADLTSTDAGTSLGAFLAGDAVFFAQGSWFAGATDAAGGGIGFTLPPAAEDDATRYSMSAPNSMVIPAAAAHPNEAAAFLDWIQRDDGRQIITEVGGLAPGGAGAVPTGDWTDRAVFAQTLEAFEQLNADNGIVGFLANASAGFTERTLTPQLDLLLAGRTTPSDFVATLQADREATAG